MPSKIDQNLLPPVIRESIDPDILNRAQSIEWSIDRDSGENERGYVDGSQDDYLSSQNLMHKSHAAQLAAASRKARKIEWADNLSTGRDSGYEYSPTSPSLGLDPKRSYSSLSSQIEDGTYESSNKLAATDGSVIYSSGNTGSMKRHPQGLHPFPIYKVNQEQLEGDVVFEVAPRAKPGERTVHYEKSSKVLNEHDMNALGLDPNFFGPNTRTTMDEQEEELIETGVVKGNELEDIYKRMATDAGDYFERQRARSVSPLGSRNPIEAENSAQKRTVIFGSVDEINTREQEFYPYRDSQNGKPLPGDNEYGTWGSRYDDKRQWKLCNGQWVRIGEPKPKPQPKMEQYLAERVKCKPPKKIQIAHSEPVRKLKPEPGSTDNSDLDDDNDNNGSRSSSPALIDSSRLPKTPRRSRLVDSSRPARAAPVRFRKVPLLEEEPIDLDALRDKYRPKSTSDLEPLAASDDDDHDQGKLATKPFVDDKPKTGTIMLEPIRPPTPPMEEIKVEPIQPIYVEIKKPLKEPEGEEEKLMEDPNLMWMRMGPAQYGPPFGSMRRRKAREEEWVGPPCELCHKQIEERRCMLAENMKFHCWHFACSFCLKTLKPADFLIAEADRKPYCLNCHKREFPEISLVNLNLETER